MAKNFEVELRIAIEEAQQARKEVASLRKEVTDFGKETKKSGVNVTAMATSVLAGIEAFRAFKDTVAAAWDGLKAFADEMERQVGILQSFEGDVRKASEAVAGLVSDIDLMAAKNKLATAGLVLTDDSFALVAKSAAAMAAALGEDVQPVLDRLTEALISGTADSLEQFGISVESGTSKAQTQAAALADLEQRFGDVTIAAETLGGRMQQLETAVENATTEFFATIDNLHETDQAFKRLQRTIDDVFGRGQSSSLTFIEEAAVVFDASFSIVVDIMNRAIATFGVFKSLLDDGLDLSDIPAAFNEVLSTLQDQITAARQLESRVRSGESVARRANQQAEKKSGRTQNQFSRGGGTSRGGSSAGFDNELGNEFFRQQQLHAGDEEISDEELRRSARGQVQILGEQGRKDIERLTEWTDEQVAAYNEMNAATIEWNTNLERVRGTAETLASVFAEGFELILQGEALTLETIGGIIDRKLQAFATEQAFEGAAALLEAIGLAFLNPPAAGAKATEGAGKLALAAAAGGASAAIPNPPSGGSAGGGAGGRRTEPRSESGGSNGGGSANITVVFQGNPLVTRADVGEAVQRSLDAHRRRG